MGGRCFFHGFHKAIHGHDKIAGMLVSIFFAHGAKIFSSNPMHGGWAIELNMFYLVIAIVIFPRKR